MKKIITLFLTVLLCFSLCACGGEKTLTKEELISTAISTDIMTLQSAVYDNRLKAKEDYCNKPISISGNVMMVEEDHIVICESQVCLDAYLSTEDIIKISSGDTVTIVGIISDIQDMEIKLGGVMPFNSPHYIMEAGYLVD